MQININFIPKTPKTYLVGGTVRDLLLGLPPADYDLVTLEDPRRVSGYIAETIGGKLIELGKPGKMVYRIVTSGQSLDVTPADGFSLEEDLKKRDFTVNALAVCLETGEVIDLFNGATDLEHGIIRMIAPDNLRADPIRLIRAFRLAACLSFSMDPATIRSIAANASCISASAGERIREELMKLLRTDKAWHHLLLMDEAGLLTAVFPELSFLKDCSQNGYHQFDVFKHTMQTFRFLEVLLHEPENMLPANHFLKNTPPEKNRWPLLKYAALLHDVGKPKTRSVDENGRVHFYNHEQESAFLAQTINKRLRLSNKQQSYIDAIIRHHLKPLSLFTAFQKNKLSPKAMIRFFMKIGNLSTDLILHAIADACGKGLPENASAFLDFTDQMCRTYTASFTPMTRNDRLVTGEDLIREFGLTPSPVFAKILRLVEEERLSRTIETRDEALSLVKNYLLSNNLS